MIMLVAGCADAVAPPADMADRHLDGCGVSRQLASPTGGAAAAAAGPLLFFKAVLSILLAMPGRCRPDLPMILSAVGYRVRANQTTRPTICTSSIRR